MKWMDEDKYIWAVLAVTALFFGMQLIRTALRAYMTW